MEDMICQGLRELQEMYTTIEGSNVTMCVKVKLLETTQGQGIYLDSTIAVFSQLAEHVERGRIHINSNLCIIISVRYFSYV